VVVSAWECELDRAKLKAAFSGPSDSDAILDEASKGDLAAA